MILLRHAPTSAVEASAFPRDEPIDARRTLKLLAGAGMRDRPDRVWLSPAMCAGQTAALLGLSGSVDGALRDCDYGDWSGRTLEAVAESQREDVERWLTDPASTPHGGESVLDLLRRVGAWLDDRRRDPGLAMAVTHAAVIRAAIVHVLRAEPSSFWRIDIEPLSRTVLTASQGHWRLRALYPIN